MSNQFADEEVSTRYTYSKSYKVKGVAEQVAILREFFPELKDATYDEQLATRLLPANAEGWFAIPRFNVLSGSYNGVVDNILVAIKAQRPFCNCNEGRTGPEYLWPHAKTAAAFQKLGDVQKGHGILIVPAQFGLRHSGRSVYQAREAMLAHEFGLGVFAVGIMLLTHPERLVSHSSYPYIDCAGDECPLEVAGECEHALCFSVYGCCIFLGPQWYDNVHYGSASAFLPQES